MAQRRGRPSHDDYLESITRFIRADIWTLKDQEAFADHIGVKALTMQFATEAWPLGIALYLLIAGSVADVVHAACVVQTRASVRIAQFLRLWYNEQRTVSSIASELQLSRSHVAKTVQRPALLLVAQRFLVLASQVDPLSESPGLRQAMNTFRHRQLAGGAG